MFDRQRLETFVAWWRQYCTGDEKGEAQIFLDRLFRALGYEGAIEAGGTFEERIRRHREGKTTPSFADFVIPKKVLIEMKKRGEDLSGHYYQAREYYIDLAGSRPQYIILCNFDEFWIYDFNIQVYDPVDRIPLEQLLISGRADALSFLLPTPLEPVFHNNTVEVTKKAAASLSEVFRRLVRRGIEREQAQRFVLQCVVALFAEDIELLPSSLFTRLIEECVRGDESTHDFITLLFHMMNTPGVKSVGRFHGVDYFDGGIFRVIYPIDLSTEELSLLESAAKENNWAKIQPAIFGAIFEKSLEKDERHRFGQHFTTEVDILRIVRPVITLPWQARIQAAASADELRQLQDELCRYRVFDPACGSGNFLNIAYREMKRLEKAILDRIAELEGAQPQPPLGLVRASQFFGYDINSFAVELAKVTLMIAKKLAVDELGLPEQVLPLDNLDPNIREADALFESWPAFDACIGNPPYLGAKRLKVERGVEYVNQVRAAFPEVPGNADYCVYWFRKAHDLMQPGTRAGLVGTNTIRQNYSRKGGLDHVVANGGAIYEAVSSIPWSGEAKVHVSIACWSKGQPPYHPARLWLDGEHYAEVPTISSALSAETDVSGAHELTVNTEPKRVFQGQTPGHKGFVLSRYEAEELLKADPINREVIFPYLTGDDLIGMPKAKPSRFIIDFGERDVIESGRYKLPLERIQQMVLPEREAKAKAERDRNEKVLESNPTAKVNHHHLNALSQWWLHFYGRLDLKEATQNLSRYVACSRVSKRPIFEFISTSIVVSDGTQVFVFEDDYSYGVIQSSLHWQWWLAKGATLKSDPAYTPNSIFDTFPFPQNPSLAQVKAVADRARTLHEYRRNQLRMSESLTLRSLYRTLELPGNNPLKDLHTTLDRAVCDAYGFNPDGDILAQLLALNQTVYTRIQNGEPVTAPGIPPDYPTPAELVSEGCITPPELI